MRRADHTGGRRSYRGTHGWSLMGVGLTLATMSTGCLDPGATGQGSRKSQALGACEAPVAAAHEIEVFFSIPDALASSGYTGEIPVTFGVPFAEGVLDEGAYLDVYQGDTVSCRRPAQFEVTGYWKPDGVSTVKWLLVDAVVEMAGGQIAPVFLQYDNGLSPAPAPAFPWTTGFAARVAQSGSAPTHALAATTVGDFVLETDGRPGTAGIESYDAEANPPTVETNGPVRTVLRVDGSYHRSAPAQRLAQFSTRYTLFRDQPYVKVLHTLTWGRDDVGASVPPADELGFDYTAPIERLAYRVPGVTPSICSSVSTPSDVASNTFPCTARELSQQMATQYLDNGTPVGGRLLGYASVDNVSPADDVFVGLRWLAEQYPAGLRYDPTKSEPLQVDLLAGSGWTWNTLAENTLTTGLWGCHPAVDPPPPNHPAGVAKTYELWLWPGDSASVTDEQKAALLEGGVVAYADPEFVVQAELPSPMGDCSSCGTSGTQPRAVIEAAISDAFSAFEADNEPGPAAASRWGAFHFGDAFYKAPSSVASNRVWMNLGAQFSVLPWMLWMRSGDRRYRRYADAQARHLSDVDRIHVDRGVQGTNCESTVASGRKNKGYQGQYDLFHTGFVISPAGGAGSRDVAGKTSEGEGLALAYHLTGDERLLDVLRERAQAVVDRWDPSGPTCGTTTCAAADCQISDQLKMIDPSCASATFGYLSPVVGPNGSGNGPVSHYALLGELLTLYEALPHQFPELKAAAVAYLDRILALQQDDGHFPGAFRTTWLVESLRRARRILPARSREVRDALSRYDDYHGSHEDIGPSGILMGSPSVTTAVARYEHTGDDRAAKRAQALALTQALSVRDAATTTGGGDAWIGETGFDPNQLGPVMRGWLEVLALYDQGLTPTSKLHPIPYLDAPRPSGATDRRQSFFAVRSYDEDLVVKAHLQHFNSGVARRRLTLDLVDATGTVQDSLATCIERVEHHYATTLPVPSVVYGNTYLSPGCTSPSLAGETASMTLPAATGPGGVYRIDATVDEDVDKYGVPQAAGTSAPVPGLAVWRVSSRPNFALDFDGASGHYLQLEANPVFSARPKMSVAFRYATAGGGNQTILTQPYQYQAYVIGTELYVRFYLTNGSSTVTPAHHVPIGASATTLEGVVATLSLDESSGDVEVSICTPANVSSGCSSATSSYPGYTPPLLTHPFTIGRNGLTNNGYYDGLVDDIRVIPRVLYAHEVEDFLFGASDWDIDVGELGGGEALLMDRGLVGESGTDHSVVHGVEGVDFTTAAQLVDTRRAKPSPLVQYFDPSSHPTPCGPLSVSIHQDDCYMRGPAPGVVGATHAVADGSSVGVCQLSGYGVQRFGVLDDGVFTAEYTASSSTPSTAICASEPAPAPGSERAVLVSLNSSAPRFVVEGTEPLYARSPQEWFDALSCHDRSVVGRFIDGSLNDGYLSLGNPTLGDAYTLSFEMNAPALPSGAEYVLAKRYEVRVYIMSGRLWVQHYGAGASPVVSAPYPEDSWLEVTSTAELVAGQIEARLYFNSVLVDEASVSASAFNRPSPGFDLLVGKQHITDTTSFSGLVDDVWVRSGVLPPSEESTTWFSCDSSYAGVLAGETFEGCPVGSGGYVNAARATGAALVVCP